MPLTNRFAADRSCGPLPFPLTGRLDLQLLETKDRLGVGSSRQTTVRILATGFVPLLSLILTRNSVQKASIAL